MKNKYGIGFFAITMITFFMILSAYQMSYQKAKEKAEEKLISQEQASADTTSESAVAADGQALKEDCYYLMEVNGYVVVYLYDRKTPYEYTNILCNELPESLQKEIANGKYIDNMQELYGFLENYSS